MKKWYKLASFLFAVVLGIGLLQPMAVSAAEDGEPDAAWKAAHSGLQELEVVELSAFEEAGEEPLVQRSAAEDEYWKKFGSDYYYNLLTDGEKLIWDRLEESCLDLIQGNYWMDSANAECLDLGMEKEEVLNVVWLFRYSNPQYYFLETTIGLVPATDGTAGAVGIWVYEDFCDGDARAEATEAFRTQVDAWVEEIQYGADEEKEKAAHDIIVENTVYDLNAAYNQSAYSMVCLGETVCAGYASTMQLLMNAVGVECIQITSYSHGWNAINIEGFWYLVDVTWDDPDSDYIRYSYYNKAEQTDADHIPREMWEGLTPEMRYDAVYNGRWYEETVIWVDDEVYSIVNDNPATGRLALQWSWDEEGEQELDKTITYDGKTYTVLQLHSCGREESTSVALNFDGLGWMKNDWLTLTSSDTDVVQIAEDIPTKWIPVGEGTARISYWDNGVWAGSEVIRVYTEPITRFYLSESMVTMELEDVVQLTPNFVPVTTTDKDSLKWESDNEAVAAVDKEGYVYAMGGGTAVITATCGELSDTCTITVNVPVVDPVEQFVTRMYEVTLDRTPDEGGLATWVNGLKDHTFTGQDIAKGFIMSEELTAKNLDDAVYVDVLYKAFFDRAADAAGKQTWVDLLNAGKSREFVLAGFVNSNEFDALCNSFGIIRGIMEVSNENATTGGTGINGFVERLYSKVLGRASDAAGIATWVGVISDGSMSAEEVSKSFFFSEEYLAKNTDDTAFVNTLYETFMNRAADADGQAFWLSYLAGGASRTEALEGFSRSVEFGEILKSYGL